MASSPSTWQWLNPSRSLAAKLALLAFSGSVTVTLVIAYTSGDRLRRTLEETALQECEVYAESTAVRFDESMASSLRSLQPLAVNPLVSAGPPEARREFLEKLLEAGATAWAGFANTSGIVAVGTERVLEGADVSKETWFQQGLLAPYRGFTPAQAQAATVPSAVAPFYGTDAQFYTYGLPVRNADGQLLGVLGVQQFRIFPGALIPDGAAQTGVGITIYSRPPKPTWIVHSRGTNGYKYLRAPTTNGRPRGSGRDTLNDREAIFGFAFNTDPSSPLMIVVRRPLELVFAPAKAMQVRMMQWGLAIGALVAIPSFVAGRRLDRKLRVMTVSAQRISAGDPFSVMPDFKTHDRLAETSAAITDMIGSLRAGRPTDSRGS